ncbi:MAG: hypothetical protein KY393_08640 [Actinobacteria bacterium]|nr:hypothetical protein [Actinomycetota bacterium]
MKPGILVERFVELGLARGLGLAAGLRKLLYQGLEEAVGLSPVKHRPLDGQ